MTPFDALMAHARDTYALEQISGRLGWDQETVMPSGAASQRAVEVGAMAGVLHARNTDPQIGEWLSQIDESTLNQVEKAQIRHLRRSYTRAGKVPADLTRKLAAFKSKAQGIWAEARANEDVAAFLPTLSEMVALTREEAACLADGTEGAEPLYDALVQDYEPGASAASLGAMFDAMRPRLVALTDQVMGARYQPPALNHRFEAALQMEIARELADAFQYDFTRGRMDKAVHPFSSGSGDDARITTRVEETDPFNCFYSTIHEVGHACYELGIDRAYAFTPLAHGVSMGVHESQSRIYENQLGRSKPFTDWLFGRMRAKFGDFGIADEEAFYGAVNRVRKGYIRTESDEVQYNLHVLLRFDLERAMISGALDPQDIEEAWNTRFEADFGTKVDRPSNGCLQDVHWSVGFFGYFPTYSLGNVYAGCLNQSMRADVAVDDGLRAGDASCATTWLRENVQTHGGLYEPSDVVEKACGFAPNEGPLLDYLEEKFKRIYRI
ncbi:MAG: carboxypeptidase M32 [Halocynthiibacter sp.]